MTGAERSDRHFQEREKAMSDETKQKDVADDQLEEISGGRKVEIDDSDLRSPDDTGQSDNPRPVGRPGSW